MPYESVNDTSLPKHVQALSEEQRRQWIAVFERVLDDTGDESEAMRQANAAVKGDRPMMDDDEERQRRERMMGKLTCVKALDESGRIGGYLVVWGSPARKDLQGEYFTPETDLALDWYPRRPVLYHHGLDTTLGIKMVGQMESMTPNDVGLWVEAQLDLRDRYTQAVWNLVKNGALGWSSGSLPHMVQVARDGQIKRWPVVEGSLTPTPAEPRDTDAVSLKHYSDAQTVSLAYKSAGLTVPDLVAPESASEGDPARDQEGSDEAGASQTYDRPLSPMEGNTMPDTLDAAKVQQMIAEGVNAVLAQKQAEADQTALVEKAARVDTLEAENAALKAQTAPGQPARRLPGHTDDEGGDEGRTALVAVDETATKTLIPIIQVMSPYDNLSAADMAYGWTVLRGLRHAGKALDPSDAFKTALLDKAWREGYRLDPAAFKEPSYRAMKANELMYSTLANYGDEWVPDLWESELWRKARVDNVILPLFRSIEMPSNPFELPIEGTDPTVYFVPETKDEDDLLLSGAGNPMPDSQVGSGKVTLSAKKFAVRVGFSAELVEDSIVPVLSLYREQAIRVMEDAIDNVLLNGDTEAGATGNINSDDEAPAATNKFMAFDGLRKLPLVTTTANKLDAAGAPTASLMRQARFLMSNRYALQPKQCVYLVDSGTYGKLLEANEIVTVDKYGQSASILTGEVGVIYGVPVLPTAEMALTEADGKLSYDTPSNNTKGQAVCAYRPGWVVGYRRRIAATMSYLPYYDAYQLVATIRLAFINFDSEVAAALYNITV